MTTMSDQAFAATMPLDRRAPVPEGWHMKKEVSVWLIIVVLAHIIVVVMYFMRIEGRLDLVQADQVVLHQTDGRMTGDITSSVAVLREDIKELRHLVEAMQRDTRK